MDAKLVRKGKGWGGTGKEERRNVNRGNNSYSRAAFQAKPGQG